MGVEDREYYQESQYGSNIFGSRGESYGQKEGLSKYSICTILVVINVAFFILDAISNKMVSPADGTHWLSYLMSIRSEHPFYIWTYLTYGFAHASYETETSFFHVGGNMIVLWFLGRPVEYRIGRIEFLRFYLVSIIAAGLGYALVHRLFGQPSGFMVGASGAVSAVVAVFIFMYPKEKLLLMGVIPMPAWLLGVLLLLTNFMSALNPNNHIAWEAHLIGGAFGVAYYMQRWNFSWLPIERLAGIFSNSPKLKIHDPDASEEKLKAEADAILQKISEHGEDSLSGKERRTLNRYSKRLRKKDRN